MTNIFYNSSDEQETRLKEALQIIHSVSESLGLEFFVVGARARDIAYRVALKDKAVRKTIDLDLAVTSVDWQEYGRFVEKLIQEEQFERVKDSKGQFLFHGELLIDFIPFGGIADHENMITWPDSDGIRMSVTGYKAALDNAERIEGVDENMPDLRVCSAPDLVVLKLISWKEGYPLRKKDAKDIHLMINEYQNNTNQEYFYNQHADILEFEDYDYALGSARLLGRDIARSGDQEAVSTVLDILEKETDEDSDLCLIRDIVESSSYQDEQIEEVRILLKWLKYGIEDGNIPFS